MDRLPLELVALVYDNLLEYDLAPGGNSEFTEEPGQKAIGHERPSQPWERTITWIQLTDETRSNLFNTRLSYWKLYHASHASFAKLLGDRKIRFTKVGTEDLERICSKVELRPTVHHNHDIWVCWVSSCGRVWRDGCEPCCSRLWRAKSTS